jgi:hypothetical protein
MKPPIRKADTVRSESYGRLRLVPQLCHCGRRQNAAAKYYSLEQILTGRFSVTLHGVPIAL